MQCPGTEKCGGTPSPSHRVKEEEDYRRKSREVVVLLLGHFGWSAEDAKICRRTGEIKAVLYGKINFLQIMDLPLFLLHCHSWGHQVRWWSVMVSQPSSEKYLDN